MKNSIYILTLILLFSCKNSQKQEDEEIKIGWGAAMSCPINDMISGPQVCYFNHGRLINSTRSALSITNSGWGYGSDETISKYGESYPDSIFVTYYGLNNKMQTWLYAGGTKLPADKISKLFKNGYYKNGKKKEFEQIITGMAPGGRICVWVDHIEIKRFNINEIEKWRDYPLKYTNIDLDEKEVKDYINHNPIDYSVWEQPDERYDLGFGFCSEDRKNTYNNCYFNSKEGVVISVSPKDIDQTFWNTPYGQKINFVNSHSYQQINELNRDNKLNFPTDGVFEWFKNGNILYSTEVVFPEKIKSKFKEGYFINGKKANYTRIVFGVEKDGEHCIVWLDGQDKQEKIIRFKGKKAILSYNKTYQDTIHNIGGYATEITYY